MYKVEKIKRFNVVFGNESLSCRGPWGLRVQRHLNIYNFKDGFVFLKCKRHYRQFLSFIEFFLKNVLNGWFVRLRFEGFGYKFRLFYRKLRVYLGHCHNVDVLLPPGIICLKDKKRKQHLLVYSLDLFLLKNYVLLLKNLRELNNYKFLGILFARQGERLKLKPGKQQFR